MALQRLKDAAEKAKIELSQMMETEINLPFITAGQRPIHMEEKLTHALEQMMNDLLERSMKPVKQALEDARCRRTTFRKWCWLAARRASEGAATGSQLLRREEPHKGVNPTKS